MNFSMDESSVAKLGFNVSTKVGLLGILGDVWDGIGSATILVDCIEVTTINNTMAIASDKAKIKQADQSYRRVLYFLKQDSSVTKPRNLELRVNSGAITINVIITNCTEQELQEDSGSDEKHDESG